MTGRKPGGPKTGGRVKGTPNKETRSLELKCEEAGIDFFEELIKIAQNPEHPDHFSAIKEGCQYRYPKKKALEITGMIDPAVLEHAQELAGLSTDELKRLIRDELSKK